MCTFHIQKIRNKWNCHSNTIISRKKKCRSQLKSHYSHCIIFKMEISMSSQIKRFPTFNHTTTPFFLLCFKSQHKVKQLKINCFLALMHTTQQHQAEKSITYAHFTAQKSETNAPATLTQFLARKKEKKSTLVEVILQKKKKQLNREVETRNWKEGTAPESGNGGDVGGLLLLLRTTAANGGRQRSRGDFEAAQSIFEIPNRPKYDEKSILPLQAQNSSLRWFRATSANTVGPIAGGVCCGPNASGG